jgi:hypothetical protein
MNPLGEQFDPEDYPDFKFTIKGDRKKWPASNTANLTDECEHGKQTWDWLNISSDVKKTVRDTCLQCVAKHLGQANVLLKETCKGYPEHYFIAIGHLAEAEDECVMKYPGLAAFLRDLRLQIEDDSGFREVYPWATVFIQVSEYMARDD